MQGPAPRYLAVAYALSGACALVYQVVWYHAFMEQFGASGTTFLVVLCAFIGGLGLGAISSRRFYEVLERTFGGRGLRNYGRTEIAIALGSLVFFSLTRLPLGGVLGHFPYRQAVVEGVTLYLPSLAYQAAKLILAVLAVGAPCFLMGLTFPYLCSLYPGDSRLPSRLYAANTLGASVAVLLTEFWGFSTVGYLGCFAFAVLGALALGLFFARMPEAAEPREPVPLAAPPASSRPLPNFPAVLSGLLCGGLQALAYSLVKFLIGPARGTFALLAFFSILGIWVASSYVHRYAPPRRALLTAAWLALAWCAAIWLVEPRLSEALVSWGAFHAPFASPYVAALATSFLVTGALIFVPYLLWSTLLPALCDRQQARGTNLSRTYGVNTLSFLAGVLVFGWALHYVSFFFAARAFALTAAVGLVLLTLVPEDGPIGVPRLAAAGAVLALGVLLIPRSLEMRLVGGHQADGYRGGPYKSTPQHLFWVRDNPDRSRALMFDGHSMSGTNPTGQIYMRSMAHLPLLLHPEPERVLLICFGVGVTADAIRLHRTVEHVDVVDLNPSVYLLNRHFAASNGNVLADTKLRLLCDDGRQFLKMTDQRYDFVTMEPPPPLQPGISRLYSREFYEDVRKRLAPGGVVSQWLPEAQMDRDGVDLIAGTFVEAFPHTLLFVGFGRDLILVGSDRPFPFGALAGRLEREPAVHDALAGFGVTSTATLLASIMRPEDSMRRQWGGAPVIRDGFTSLDALQICSPVQRLHPRSTWSGPKPALRFDPAALLAELRQAAPGERSEVQQMLLDPSRRSPNVPPWYLVRE